MKEGKRICIFGSANADYFLYVKNIPVKGQTLQANRYLTANGGKGANQAVAVAKLNASSHFIGQVGNDDAMRRLQTEMKAANVHLHWRVLENEPTGMAYIYVDKDGQNSIVIYGGANMNFENKEQLEPAFREVIDSCDYLLLQKEIPMSLVEAASVYAKGKGKTVILDCGGQDEPISETILSNIAYISPNETQLLRIDPTINLGEDFNLEEAAKEIRIKLLQKHPQLKVLLKLGSKGAAMITWKHAVMGPSVTAVNPKVLDNYKIVDTVGAGDCFTGAFAVRHSELDWSDQSKEAANYQESMTFGNASAFLCITKYGAMPSMPQRQDVDAFLKTYLSN